MNKHWLYLLLLFVVPLQAQVDLSYYLAEDHPYDPSIPTPQSVLGYEVGNWHVSHDRLIQYMRALADASDRIQLTTRGYTYEQRPIVLLTITSPNNHSKIDQIQADHALLTSAAAEQLDLSKMPLVVYQDFPFMGMSLVALTPPYWQPTIGCEYRTRNYRPFGKRSDFI